MVYIISLAFDTHKMYSVYAKFPNGLWTKSAENVYIHEFSDMHTSLANVN